MSFYSTSDPHDSDCGIRNRGICDCGATPYFEPPDHKKIVSYLQQENSVLHERLRKLEIALEKETERCAKVAEERAEICRQAMSGPPESLPEVEVHCLNEALHIAQLIRSRR